MTVEDRLREALRVRADAVVPAEPEWSRVANRFGRRRRRRASAAVMPVLAAFAVLMTAVIVWIESAGDGSRPLRTAGPPAPAEAPATLPALPSPDDLALPTPRDPIGGSVPAGFRPMSVTWISPLQGWVLGELACANPPCPALLRTTDGGATWTGGGALYTGPLRSTVRFADARNGWIYGEHLWATHNAGSTWARVNGLEGEVSSVESFEDRAWAVVNYEGRSSVYTSAVGTDDWRPAGSTAVKPFSSVVLQGAGGYVVGADDSVLAVSPGGLDRRGEPCGNSASLVSLAPAGSDLFALCVSGPAAGSAMKTLLVSSDGARTWSTAGIPPRAGSATGLAAASRSTIVVWAASGASLLYRSDDGGRTWTTVHEDITRGGGFFHDLGFTSASRGSVMLGSPPNGILLQTSDGGRTWSPVVFGP